MPHYVILRVEKALLGKQKTYVQGEGDFKTLKEFCQAVISGR